MIQNYISSTLLILGAVTLLISSIGLIRLPDFLTRSHPAAKSSTLGIIFFFAGVAVEHPEWSVKLLMAIILFMLTGPVATSALVHTALSEDDKKRFYDKTEDENSNEEGKN